MNDTFFLPFAKADADQQTVYGIASTDGIDDQSGVWEGKRYDGDVVDPQALRDALADYWGNIREMHGPNAAGKALDVLVGDDGRTYIIAKITDSAAWQKIKDGVYKGFSIAGKILDGGATLKEINGRVVRWISKLMLSEISLVDRPANPDAVILLYKRSTNVSKEQEKPKAADRVATPEGQPNAEDDALTKLSGIAKMDEAKAAKIVTQVQALRNEAELEGDLEGAERMTQVIALLMGGGSAPEEEEETSGDDMEMMDEEEEPMAMREAAVAMSLTAALHKAGRKISASRMKVMKDAVMAYLKLLAEVGDEDAVKMLRYASADEPDEAMKMLRSDIETIAKAMVRIYDDVQLIKNQPVAGGPIGRFAGQPVTKQLTASQPVVQTPNVPDVNPQIVAQLKQRIATEPRAELRAQYMEQLRALQGGN